MTHDPIKSAVQFLLQLQTQQKLKKKKTFGILIGMYTYEVRVTSHT